MARKLKSVFRIPKLRSLIKALFVVSAVYFWPWLGFSLAVFFYFYPNLSGVNLAASFIASLALIFVFRGLLPPWFFVLFFSVVFFLFWGLKELTFAKKARAHLVFALLISLLVFWGFFSGVIEIWLLPLTLFFVIREFLNLNLPQPSNRHALFSALLALVILELAWLMTWLLFPPVVLTSLLFLIFGNLLYLAVRHLEGGLSRQTILISVLAIIFAFLLTPVLGFW